MVEQPEHVKTKCPLGCSIQSSFLAIFKLMESLLKAHIQAIYTNAQRSNCENQGATRAI